MALRVPYSAPVSARTNFPKVSTSYAMLPTDAGVAVTKSGVTITLPAISVILQDGDPYSVKNISGGNITINAAGSDAFSVGTGTQTSESIYTESDQDFRVETTTLTWILM